MPRKNREITVDYIMSMVEAEDGHLIWQGPTVNKGKDPRARTGKKLVNVRRLLWELTHNKKVPKNCCICTRCDVWCCVEPTCLVCRTRSAISKGPKTKLHAMRIAAGKRARSAYSDEVVAEVKRSELGAQDEAARHGMSKPMVVAIRAGKVRRDYSSPFAGLGAQR